MIISNKAHAILLYQGETTEEYHFQLSYIDETTLDLLSVLIPSDSRINIISHCNASVQDLNAAMPRRLRVGAQFATNLEGGGYTTTVASTYDRMEGIPFVDGANYQTAQFFSAFLPMLLRPFDVYYTKDGYDPNEIPLFIPGYSKYPLPDGGDLFIPDNEHWNEGIIWLATSQGGGYRTCRLKAHWLYGSGELPYQDSHIWLHWDEIYSDIWGIGFVGYGKSISTPPNMTLPNWDQEGDYPTPIAGTHVAWRYFYDGKLYFKELLGIPDPDYPVKIFPRKDDFPPDDTFPDEDDFFDFPSEQEGEPGEPSPLKLFSLIHSHVAPPPPALESLTVYGGLTLVPKSWPTLPLAVSL